MTLPIRAQLSRDVMLGMTKIETRMEGVWVDECTHEGVKKLAPVKNVTPFIDYLIEQGWTKTRKYCREICDHGGSCSLELNHTGNHESKNDLGNITYCSWGEK